VKVIL